MEFLLKIAELHSQLQEISKKALTFNEQTNSPYEAQLLKHFQGDESMEWSAWTKKLSATLGVGIGLCDKLQFLLGIYLSIIGENWALDLQDLLVF